MFKLSASKTHPKQGDSKGYYQDFKPVEVKNLKKLGKLMRTHAVCTQQFKEPKTKTNGGQMVNYRRAIDNIETFDGKGCIFFDVDNKEAIIDRHGEKIERCIEGPVNLSEIEGIFKELGWGCVILASKSSKQSWEKFHIGAFIDGPPGTQKEFATVYKSIISGPLKSLALDIAMHSSVNNMSPNLNKKTNKIISIVKGSRIDLKAFKDVGNDNTSLESVDAQIESGSHDRYDEEIHFLHREDSDEKLSGDEMIDIIESEGYVRCGCHNSKSHGNNDGGAFCNKTDSGNYFYYCNGCGEGIYIMKSDERTIDPTEVAKLRNKYPVIVDKFENDLLFEVNAVLAYIDNSIWNYKTKQVVWVSSSGGRRYVDKSDVSAIWDKVERDLTPDEKGAMKESLLMQYYGEGDYTTTQRSNIIGKHKDIMYKKMIAFLVKHKQISNTVFKNDIWSKKNGIDIDRGAAIFRTTEIMPVKKKYEEAYDEEVIKDYKKHFGKKGDFEAFLDVMLAHRFGHGLREAFYWVQATSGFGKTFLFKDILSDNLGIGYNMEMEELKLALDGKPSGVEPENINGSWFLFFDEFNKLHKGLKNIISDINVTPKGSMRVTVPIYMKIFTSYDDVAGLGSGGGTSGVESQFANRFSKLEKSGVLKDRKVRKKNIDYIEHVTRYIYQYLHKGIDKYFKMGRKRADKKLSKIAVAYTKKHTIKNSTVSKNNVIEHEGIEWLTNFIKESEINKLAEAGIYHSNKYGYVIHGVRLGELKDEYMKSFDYQDEGLKMGDIKRAPAKDLFGIVGTAKNINVTEAYLKYMDGGNKKKAYILNIS